MEEEEKIEINPDDDPKSKEYADINSAPWLTKHIASILAVFTILLSFTFFFILVFCKLDPEKKDIIIYILGVLSAIDSQIFSFYYGSSKESETKNRMIHQQMNK